jgi:hypothetical protein
MLQMCSVNLASEQPCVAPLGHFTNVAQRLALTQQQLTHLRLMLRQYNRSMQQQLQDGLSLLQVSHDIAGVQTAVVAAQVSKAQCVKTEAAAAAANGLGGADVHMVNAANGTNGAGAGSACDVAHRAGSKDSSRKHASSGTNSTGTTQKPKQQQQNGGSSSSSSSDSSSGDSEVDAHGLSLQLQQHLSERMRVMQVNAFAFQL